VAGRVFNGRFRHFHQNYCWKYLKYSLKWGIIVDEISFHEIGIHFVEIGIVFDEIGKNRIYTCKICKNLTGIRS